MSDRLRKLIDESRDELGAREVRDIDWDTVDRELFARLDQERRLERTRAVGPRTPAWGVGAAVLAAAAVLALVAGKTHSTRSQSLDAAPLAVAVAAPAAGNVTGILGGGDLLIDGKPATTGATLRLGNVVETRGTSVTVERPGKLSMILEAGTHATVTHVQGALVLALDTGAVEAQVVPVPSGEAFAVDVMGTRVAVHGTHLRVARDHDQVAVDLNEGVVVVGAAPREGSTVGTLVTAPAHADFAAPDLAASLKVTHEASAVRPPNGIAVSAQPAAPGTVSVAAVPAAPATTSRPEGARPPALAAAPVVRPAALAPPAGAAPAPSVPAADPNAAATLAAAVRACVTAHPSPENVTVVVNTTLHVDLDADGNVKAARFEPPVAPDVNTCAAPVIYRTRFAHDGSADVPVDVKVPASAP
jgi:hypothetical protein